MEGAGHVDFTLQATECAGEDSCAHVYAQVWAGAHAGVKA